MKQVTHIELLPDRVNLAWVDTESDIRNEGKVMIGRNMVVMRVEDYLNEITAVEYSANALLEDALEDFEATTPVDLTISQGENDD